MSAYGVAIVDDERATRSLVGSFLQECGYDVLIAETPDAALHLARGHMIDAFIISLELQSGDALLLCRQIRSLETHQRTPIFCLTDMAHPEALQNAFGAGADDFIAKPVNLISLAGRLNAHVQKMDYFRKLDRARQQMQRYLSRRVAMLVQEYSETGKVPPPEERFVSVCFTDIRGFTALSESMDPEQLFASLSSHLGTQVELVHQFGGYVDKFNGDGLMAIFDGDDQVEQCCLCALTIMETTIKGHPAWDLFPIGIGIHSGKAMIGNIGSPEHLDYSAVGPTVNLAARLSGYAQPETIMVSDSVRAELGNKSSVAFVDPRDVQIRGVNSLVRIFKLVRGAARAATGMKGTAEPVL